MIALRIQFSKKQAMNKVKTVLIHTLFKSGFNNQYKDTGRVTESTGVFKLHSAYDENNLPSWILIAPPYIV